MSNLIEYQEALGALVPVLPLDEEAVRLAVEGAMLTYSLHRPRTDVVDLPGSGGFDYALSLLSSWAENFSRIVCIEYPVDDEDPAASELGEDEWTLYETPGGRVIRLMVYRPDVGEVLRVRYTMLHRCDAEECSVPGIDEAAVKALAAAGVCDMCAAYYSADENSSIGADSVDHSTPAAEYAKRARGYRARFYNHLGVKPGEIEAASGTADWDMTGAGGRERLTRRNPR